MIQKPVGEYPIIFSGPMIRSILENRKTQTRRVAKLINQIAENHSGVRVWWKDGTVSMSREAMYTPSLREPFEGIVCPYGAPGDRLWVRETWIPVHHGSYEVFDRKIGFGDRPAIVYAADPGVGYHEVWDNYKGKWHPSIFMPRWASRITLEITEVRVQRVQEIENKDAVAEGIMVENPDADYYGASTAFKHLWDTINAKRGYGWESNPFCWVLTFKRVG
jgi:hypothetical protein